MNVTKTGCLMTVLIFGFLLAAEPALAAGVDTASTGLLQKWIDWFMGIRSYALTLAAVSCGVIVLFFRQYLVVLWYIAIAMIIMAIAPYIKDWL